MLELIFSEYRPFAQDILTVLVCIGAFVWGGAPERIVAATWLLVFEFPGRIYRAFVSDGLQLADIDAFLATTDVVAGIVWIAVALYANRNYTLFIAGMQVLAMTAHVARGLADAISPVAYMTMVVAPGWFQLIFLGFGVIFHARRKKKYGEYRDWRVPLRIPLFSPASTTAGGGRS